MTVKTIRVSKWLQDKYPLLNQRQREEALDFGLVLDDSGKKIKKGEKVPSTSLLNCEGLNRYIEILKKGSEITSVKLVKQETGFVVVDKPIGLASHPISLFDEQTMTQWARFHYPSVANEFLEIQPTLVPHRLDTGTSGILLVALEQQHFVKWREAFKSKRVTKQYLAWCWGDPQSDDFSCEFSIGHAMGDSRKMVALRGNVRYRPPVFTALSKITVVKKVKERGIFLAKIDCSTGVTHQVRIHLATLGFPLVGDELYDPEKETRKIKRPFHALRAISLTYDHWTYTVETQIFQNEY